MLLSIHVFSSKLCTSEVWTSSVTYHYISQFDSLVFLYVTIMHNGLKTTSLGHIQFSQKTMPGIINTLGIISFSSKQHTNKHLSSIDIIAPFYSSKKMGYLMNSFQHVVLPLSEKDGIASCYSFCMQTFG